MSVPPHALARRRPGGWPVVVIVGPTGSGKTEIALEVARRLSAEVISADSRQIYQGLSIGTAKPEGKWTKTPSGPRFVVEGVVHHFLDHVPPMEICTAGRFAREAKGVIEDLERRNKPAVMVGGTGMYLRALVRGLAVLPEGNASIRRMLQDRASREGRAVLHGALVQVDPVSAQNIPANNIQRVIRALEVHQLTGRPLSQLQKEGTHPAPWDFAWFGLQWDPPAYQERLKQRCRSLEKGILGEIKTLLREGVSPSAPAFQSLGYREGLAHLNGRLSRDEFGRELLKQTRLYAKRQMTWFRGEPSIRWINVGGQNDIDRMARDWRTLDGVPPYAAGVSVLRLILSLLSS